MVSIGNARRVTGVVSVGDRIMTKEKCLELYGELPEDPRVLELLPDEILPLTGKDLERGRAIAKEFEEHPERFCVGISDDK